MGLVEKTNATSETFDSLIAEGTVLVDFWGIRCMPCKLLDKQLDSLETNVPIVKVQVEQCYDIVQRYNVMGTPTLILFKDGQPVKEVVGYKSKAEILDLING